jgi:hypothetical protein
VAAALQVSAEQSAVAAARALVAQAEQGCQDLLAQLQEERRARQAAGHQMQQLESQVQQLGRQLEASEERWRSKGDSLVVQRAQLASIAAAHSKVHNLQQELAAAMQAVTAELHEALAEPGTTSSMAGLTEQPMEQMPQATQTCGHAAEMTLSISGAAGAGATAGPAFPAETQNIEVVPLAQVRQQMTDGAAESSPHSSPRNTQDAAATASSPDDSAEQDDQGKQQEDAVMADKEGDEDQDMEQQEQLVPAANAAADGQGSEDAPGDDDGGDGLDGDDIREEASGGDDDDEGEEDLQLGIGAAHAMLEPIEEEPEVEEEHMMQHGDEHEQAAGEDEVTGAAAAGQAAAKHDADGDFVLRDLSNPTGAPRFQEAQKADTQGILADTMENQYGCGENAKG